MSPDARNKFIIFGPPGTGKTTRLRKLIRDCAQRYGAEAIVATSFSRTAAIEIAAPRDGEDDLGIPANHIGTMHKLCFDLLGRPTIAEGKLEEFAKAHAQYELSETQKRALNLDEPEADQHFETIGDAVLARYNHLRNRQIPREQWPLSVRSFAAKWEAWKEESGYLDFTDLIDRCLSTGYYGIPYAAQVLIGDEGQDLTPLQHALFDKWAAQAEYTVIAGDDDQTIFSHTGATAEAFLDPTIPADHKSVLAQSNRVPASVQRVAEAWIRGVRKREPKVYSPRRDADGRIVEGAVRSLPATWRDPLAAVKDAEKMLDAGASVMFLAACSYMVQPLIDLCRERGVPFGNRYRLTRGDWNPLTSRGTTMSRRLLALMKPQLSEAAGSPRMWNWYELDLFCEILKADGVLQRGAKSEIAARADDKHVRGQEVDLDELLKLFHGEAFGHLAYADLAWFEDHMLPAKRAAFQFPKTILAKRGADALSELPRVTVGTIHSVKGGEADVVYLFPDISKASMKEFLNYGAGYDAVIRQFYVGVTRARSELVVCDASGRDAVELPINYARKKVA